MPTTDTKLQQLVINVGTKAQIESAIAGGTITENMLSVATDGDTYIQGVKVNGTELTPDSNNKVNVTVPTQASDIGAQPTLESGANIKTVNGNSLLGEGDLAIGGLPDQTGQSGKYLTTDGTDASWGTLNALQNETTNTSSVNIVPISGSPSIINNNNVLIHSKLTNINNTGTVGINTPYGGVGNLAVCINGNHAQGYASVSIGNGAQSLGAYSVAVGPYAHADGQRNIALGYYAQTSSSKSDVIQLGYGSDSSQESFGLYAGFTGYSNYKLLDGTTGKIPDGRLPIAASVSSSSTNAEVVGAKLFYDTVGDIESTINAIRGV